MQIVLDYYKQEFASLGIGIVIVVGFFLAVFGYEMYSARKESKKTQ